MPKIKSIHAIKFKRFTDLTVTDIPESVRLVVLLGPNGCGKTSLFEIFNMWIGQTKNNFSWGEGDYYVKRDEDSITDQSYDLTARNNVRIEFHEEIGPASGSNPKAKKAFYLRSSYRHEALFQVNTLSRADDPIADTRRPITMIQPDARISDNYLRIVSDQIEMLNDQAHATTTAREIRDCTIGPVRQSLARLFGGDFQLNSLGNPFDEGTFTFAKGASRNFRFKNLSGGERAAFDLVLDFVLKAKSFDDTVFCVDEPELHIHSSLQGTLLEELYNLLPGKCQLWIASHSAGVLRKALEMHQRNPSDVAFLDFFDLDLDAPQVIRPAKVNRNLWKKAFHIALHDLADLVAPREIIICEGSPLTVRSGKQKNAAFDAKVYNLIFSDSHPDSSFVSAGNCNDVVKDSIKLEAALNTISPGVKITTLIDRDNMSEEQVNARRRSGKVLSRYSIENFLWSDEILQKLLHVKCCTPRDIQSILAAKMNLVNRPVSSDEGPLECVKDIEGPLFTELTKLQALRGNGTTANDFALSALVPLVTTDTAAYKQLESDIFS